MNQDSASSEFFGPLLVETSKIKREAVRRRIQFDEMAIVAEEIPKTKIFHLSPRPLSFKDIPRMPRAWPRQGRSQGRVKARRFAVTESWDWQMEAKDKAPGSRAL